MAYRGGNAGYSTSWVREMLEPTKLTIESPEVLAVLGEYNSKMGHIAPWLHKELSAKEREDWGRLILQEAGESLVQLGYWKTASIDADISGETAYLSKVRELARKKIDQEGFTNWCKTDALFIKIDSIVRCHQRGFGLSEVGYVPSERLVGARVALASYQEAQQGVNPLAHTPLFEKLKEEVAKAGFDSLEQFLELNGALP